MYIHTNMHAYTRIPLTQGACVQIATGVVSTMTPHPEKMLQALSVDMLATDLVRAPLGIFK